VSLWDWVGQRAGCSSVTPSTQAGSIPFNSMLPLRRGRAAYREGGLSGKAKAGNPEVNQCARGSQPT
jgi:hypothetical protein